MNKHTPKTPSARLSSLPREILSQIASYLPLPAVRSLLLSNPRLFRAFHGHITHTPSFAPWRRRYFKYEQIHERAWRAMHDFAVDMRNKSAGEITASGQVLVRTPLEQELEDMSQEMARDLGLIPSVGGAQANTGAVPVSMSRSQGPNSSISPSKILLPRITTNMLFTALEHISGPRAGHLKLQLLECSLSAIMGILCQNYSPIELIQKLVPVPLLPKSSSPGPAAEAAATYKVFTAYLLFTSLTPSDIFRVLSDALFASGKDLYSVDAIRGFQEVALVEYFHLLRLFLLMHEYDNKIRCVEAMDPTVEGISFQARKLLSGRLDVWIRRYFRPERPLPPPTPPVNQFHGSNTSTKQTRERALSMSTPPSSPTKVCKTPTSQSRYRYPSPSPIAHQPSTEYVLTQEQKKVVGTDVRPGELMKVRAYAGTGKTLSLVEYAKKRPHAKFLYVAFNKSAAEDAKMKFPRNVICKTMHSVAYGTIKVCAPEIQNALTNGRKPISDRRWRTMEIPHNFSAKEIIELLGDLDNAKISSLLVNPQAHMQPGVRQKQEGKKRFPTPNAVATVIKKILSKYWSSKDIEIGGRCLPQSMVEMLGLKGDILMEWARKIWKEMQTAKAKYLPHDAYLKILHLDGAGKGAGIGGSSVSAANAAAAMRSPVRGSGDKMAFSSYDIIMWDEAQDSNPSMAEIIFRQRPWVGLIVVGDPYQKIYGFRGATNEFSDDKAHKPTYSCYLTHSFRFGDAIAGVANLLLRSLRENIGVNGVRKHDSVKASLPQVLEMSLARKCKEVRVLKPGAVEDGGSGRYTVIFRKNITLVEYALEYCMSHSHLGHRVCLRTAGNFNKSSLFTLLKNANALYKGTPSRYGILAGYKTWQDLKDQVNAEISDGEITDSPGLSLVIGLEELIASDNFLKDLKLCEDMVLDDGCGEIGGDVILITTHQAKGLEWDRVVVADDFNPEYSRRESLGKTKHWREEMFMTYVAVTRAKKELIVGGRIAAWLAAEMGMYRFYVSPTQGMGKCPVCLGKPPADGSNAEDELKREGVVMGYECVLPAGSFGAMITEPEAKSRRPFGPRKDVVACDLCVQDWFHADRVGTDTEMSMFSSLTIQALNRSKGAATQTAPNEGLILSERSTLTTLYKTVYQKETEIVNMWVEGRSALSVAAASEEEREGVDVMMIYEFGDDEDEE